MCTFTLITLFLFTKLRKKNLEKQKDCVKPPKKRRKVVLGNFRKANVSPTMSKATEGTIRPAEFFDPTEKAEEIKEVLSNPRGPDLDKIIDILCGCSNSQRQQIKHEFKKISDGRELQGVLDTKLKTGEFKDVIIRMLYTPAEYDAVEVRQAMKGLGTKEEILIEIFCTRKITHIDEVKREYSRLFARDLKLDVRSETSGNFANLCELLLQDGRVEPGRQMSPQQAKTDAQELFYAGSTAFSSDSPAFHRILATQSIPQIKLVLEEYKTISGQDLEDAICAEISNLLHQKTYGKIIRLVKNPAMFFAEALHNSMKGVGTRDRDLKRIIISRSEMDMVQIKMAFLRQYGKGLEHWIKNDCSGAYQKVLLHLIQE